MYNSCRELKKLTREQYENQMKWQRCRFISSYSCKVRENYTLAKKNWETMGLPYVPLSPPECYLKKHSIKKPVWICKKPKVPCCVPPKDGCCCERKCAECRPQRKRKLIDKRFCAGFNWKGDVKVMNRGPKNYIKDNVLNTLRLLPTVPKRAHVDDQKGHRVEYPPCKHYLFKDDFGMTPLYIEKRKKQLYWQMVLEKMMSDPAGCEYIGERERCNILRTLEDELAERIRKCTLCVSGYDKSRIRHGGIERELCELQNDISLFRKNQHIFINHGRSVGVHS